MENYFEIAICAVGAICSGATAFMGQGWRLKTLAILGALISLYLGISGSYDSYRLNNELKKSEASSTIFQSAFTQSQASATALQTLVIKLQKQIPLPQENDLYNSLGQVVAQVPSGEWPNSQSNFANYDRYGFHELCNVTEIKPNEIITAYPFGKAINMKIDSSSTVSGQPVMAFSESEDDSYACSNLASDVIFLLVR